MSATTDEVIRVLENVKPRMLTAAEIYDAGSFDNMTLMHVALHNMSMKMSPRRLVRESQENRKFAYGLSSGNQPRVVRPMDGDKIDQEPPQKKQRNYPAKDKPTPTPMTRVLDAMTRHTTIDAIAKDAGLDKVLLRQMLRDLEKHNLVKPVGNDCWKLGEKSGMDDSSEIEIPASIDAKPEKKKITVDLEPLPKEPCPKCGEPMTKGSITCLACYEAGNKTARHKLPKPEQPNDPTEAMLAYLKQKRDSIDEAILAIEKFRAGA